MTVGSVVYQRRYYPVCQGGLSAGFPIAFVCDGGGSPVSSWGKIDLADWINVIPLALLLDILLYGALISLAGLIGSGILRRSLPQDEYFRWGVLICIGYVVIFIFAFLSFQANSLKIEIAFPRTPTPIVFTSTPFGTPPPPPWTPFPTVGP